MLGDGDGVGGEGGGQRRHCVIVGGESGGRQVETDDRRQSSAALEEAATPGRSQERLTPERGRLRRRAPCRPQSTATTLRWRSRYCAMGNIV